MSVSLCFQSSRSTVKLEVRKQKAAQLLEVQILSHFPQVTTALREPGHLLLRISISQGKRKNSFTKGSRLFLGWEVSLFIPKYTKINIPDNCDNRGLDLYRYAFQLSTKESLQAKAKTTWVFLQYFFFFSIREFYFLILHLLCHIKGLNSVRTEQSSGAHSISLLFNIRTEAHSSHMSWMNVFFICLLPYNWTWLLGVGPDQASAWSFLSS